jgi:hypothetical protein
MRCVCWQWALALQCRDRRPCIFAERGFRGIPLVDGWEASTANSASPGTRHGLPPTFLKVRDASATKFVSMSPSAGFVALSIRSQSRMLPDGTVELLRTSRPVVWSVSVGSPRFLPDDDFFGTEAGRRRLDHFDLQSVRAATSLFGGDCRERERPSLS